MDLKRYEVVAPREAMKKLLDGERVCFVNDWGNVTTYYLNVEDRLYGETEEGDVFGVETSIDEILERDTWYVKKPFDVRAEMLARPDEWVGAFKNDRGKWYKVGLSTIDMTATETRFFKEDNTPEDSALRCTEDELNQCIPIEDVPEEELT